MRGQRLEPRRQRARAANQNPHDRGAQIIVRDARGHAIEMRKGADVPVEKADLILALVNPGEVATGVHQPHQEEPRFAPRAVDVDQDLEEIDLGEITRPIRQRDEHLSPLSLPLGDRVFDDRHAHAFPFRQQHLVQPCGGQPLFAGRPSHGIGQQRLHPIGHRIPDRPRSRRRRLSTRDRLMQVLTDGDARDPQLTGDRPLRPPLHQHFVPDNMHLIHPEHPPANPGSLDPASSPSHPQVVYFLSGEWPSF